MSIIAVTQKKTQPLRGDDINMLAKRLFIHACTNSSQCLFQPDYTSFGTSSPNQANI